MLHAPRNVSASNRGAISNRKSRKATTPVRFAKPRRVGDVLTVQSRGGTVVYGISEAECLTFCLLLNRASV